MSKPGEFHIRYDILTLPIKRNSSYLEKTRNSPVLFEKYNLENNVMKKLMKIE